VKNELLTLSPEAYVGLAVRLATLLEGR